MPTVTTRAILLRALPYSETSRVLRFYAYDLGLVGVMGRGVRRVASRGKGAMGTFSEGVAVLSIREGRSLQTLREFATEKTRLGLAGDLRRLAGASVAAELLLRHAAEEPFPELYNLFSAGLDRVEAATPAQADGEVLALVWQMVRLLGFGPELGACTNCSSPLQNADMGHFDLEAGGVRCPRCAADGSRRVGPRARAQLESLLNGEVPQDLRKPGAHLSLLDDFVTFHLLGGRRLGSFRFLHPSASVQHIPADAPKTRSDIPRRD